MADATEDKRFDSSRAEIFETLGHPVRIKILESLENGPLGFADLKRGAGLDSSGNLQFHLGKLGDMVSLTPEGNYALTDDGREALRIVASVSATKQDAAARVHKKGRVSIRLPILAIIIASLVLTSSVALYQQYQTASLGTSQTYGTITIGINDYWYMTLPAASVAPETVINFHGMSFRFMPDASGNVGTTLWTNGSKIDYQGMVASCGHNMTDLKSIQSPLLTSPNQTVPNPNSITFTFNDNSTCTIPLGNETFELVPILSPTTVTVTFPDAWVEALSSGWPFPNAPAHVNSTYALARGGASIAGVGTPWLSNHIPFAGILLNPDKGTITIYVREY